MISTRRKPDIPIIELKPLEGMGDLVLPSSVEAIAEVRYGIARRYFLFILMVVLPMLGCTIYYGFVASGLYAVDASYVVRMIQGSGGAELGLLGSGQNYARSEDDTYAVNAYLQSRDAFNDVKPIVKQILEDKTADFLQRGSYILRKSTDEALYERYLNLIHLKMDGTGITNIEVLAYDPETAKDLSERLLKLGENIVNQMNERAVADTVRQAKLDVKESEDEYQQEQMRLMAFRNRELMVDPQLQSNAVFEIIGQLMGRVAQEEAGLAQIVALSPKSPQIQSIKSRIKALQSQIEDQRSQVVGGSNSLVNKWSEYEQLALRRELASRKLASSINSLDRARQDARRQQFYLETIVRPIASDQARYPRRVIDCILALIICLSLYWITSRSVSIIAEHQV